MLRARQGYFFNCSKARENFDQVVLWVQHVERLGPDRIPSLDGPFVQWVTWERLRSDIYFVEVLVWGRPPYSEPIRHLITEADHGRRVQPTDCERIEEQGG